MNPPLITSIYAAAFAVLFVILSIQVVVIRGRTGIVHGDGQHDLLNRKIRAHGNFAEYVPLILLLVSFLEMSGRSPTLIHALLAPLMLARLMHPVGMLQPVASVRQYAWRASSMTITWLVTVAAAAMLIQQSV